MHGENWSLEQLSPSDALRHRYFEPSRVAALDGRRLQPVGSDDLNHPLLPPALWIFDREAQFVNIVARVADSTSNSSPLWPLHRIYSPASLTWRKMRLRAVVGGGGAWMRTAIHPDDDLPGRIVDRYSDDSMPDFKIMQSFGHQVSIQIDKSGLSQVSSVIQASGVHLLLTILSTRDPLLIAKTLLTSV